jgi:hypothetical protein
MGISTQELVWHTVTPNRINGMVYTNGTLPALEVSQDKMIARKEDQARQQQKKELKKALSRNPFTYTPIENTEQRVGDGRRIEGDLITPWERAFVQVQEYKRVFQLIQDSGQKGAVTHELIKNWTTILNFPEIATLLTFTKEEVESLIAEINNNEIQARKDIPEMDKSAPWYESLLGVVTEDDIVNVVLARQLILELKHSASEINMVPTLRDLFVGLQTYFDEEYQTISSSIQSWEAKLEEFQMLAIEMDQLYSTLRSMNRAPRTIQPIQKEVQTT